MPSVWGEKENHAIVSDYLEMLVQEITGQTPNKAERRRLLQPELNGRSNGAIEFKHQNISAVLIELGCPYIAGYQPAGNFQRSLMTVVVAHLEREGSLRNLLTADAERSVSAPEVEDILAIQEEPPKFKPTKAPTAGIIREARLAKRDYLEREAQNRALGLQGEMFAINFERARLQRCGRSDLADRIEHVSVTRGDGDGFDVLSFDESGSERFVEVKTTKHGNFTPFFASSNEVHVSHVARDRYHLYRLYNFRNAPGLYARQGSLEESCVLTPISYRGLPR